MLVADGVTGTGSPRGSSTVWVETPLPRGSISGSAESGTLCGLMRIPAPTCWAVCCETFSWGSSSSGMGEIVCGLRSWVLVELGDHVDPTSGGGGPSEITSTAVAR